VVISDTTAHLVETSGLPDGVQLRDLGSHRLKDLPAPERLFQLRVPGLQADFPPLKSLGAASSLPVAHTPLVGRTAYLTQLIELLRSRETRLVTLTGPGGAGKTRLAIEVARRLVDVFPDGVYFVPLAPVTSPEAMRVTIGEVLGVPPDARTPPALYDHLAHRESLLVLDNLEQLNSADDVVCELLDSAHAIVVLTTSRRPLHAPGEHEHAVEPLAVPAGDALSDVARSAAVQMFVQHASSVRSSFSLTDANAADVAAICRHLDGLPLAIELAAARTKMLSPHALLGRLDQALDIAAVSGRVPSRQHTHRETIAWSYDLLPPTKQKLFRWLAVFVGGADLEAIGAVMSADRELAGQDPLDLVAALVDASLATVSESEDGEPRIGILKTMRAFALDQLVGSGEVDRARAAHARHDLQVADGLSLLFNGAQERDARLRFELELGNFREALTWATTPGGEPAGDRPMLGMRLAAALDGLWFASSFFAEEGLWVQRAVDCATGEDTIELANCLEQLGRMRYLSGDLEPAYEQATSSVAMWRRIGQPERGFSQALETLGNIQLDRGHPSEAHHLLIESVEVAREHGPAVQLCSALLCRAVVVGDFLGDYQAAYETERDALDLALQVGSPTTISRAQLNLACSLRVLGRPQEAKEQMRSVIARSLTLGRRQRLCVIAEDYAAVLVELGEHAPAVTLLAAAEQTRTAIGTPRVSAQVRELAGPISKARAALTTAEWQRAESAGQSLTVDEALAPHASTSDP
jgi:predicted ATPase